MQRPEAVVDRINTTAPSLAEQVLGAVQASIRSGKMIPGELYSVYQLATDLGVSRSPVREALLRLAETGVVVFEPNRGFRIRVPGPREIAEVFSVRLALEVPAVRRAAVNVTNRQLQTIDENLRSLKDAAERGNQHEFMQNDQSLHGIILDIAGNSYAKQIIDNIRNATRLVGASTLHHRGLLDVYNEHLPITDALHRHDADAAAAAMELHLKSTGWLLVNEAIAQKPSFDGDEAELWDSLIS